MLDKLIQMIGIVLLFLVDLNGFEGILGKKRAWLLLSVRKFVLDPLIHTSHNRVFTTGYGNWISRGKSVD